jgi:hypothetical protein
MMFLLWWGMVSACLQATTISEFWTPNRTPKFPTGLGLGGTYAPLLTGGKKQSEFHTHIAPPKMQPPSCN